MAEDRAHDARRIPNSAAPIVWQKDTQKFEEPYRHASVEDFDGSHEAKRAADTAAFERGDIKTANEMLSSGEIPSAYRK